MWNPFKNLFVKSAERTLKESGDRIAAGWSHDTPTKQDAKGNITHYCAEAAMASIHRGNPSAWKFIKAAINPVSTAANSMSGINVLGEVNCRADMTKEKMLGFFRQAEAAAREARE